MWTYKLIKVNKLGEFDDTYGQVFWCEAAEELIPIKFNSKHQELKAGDEIAAEEKVLKKSTKGTEYAQLKGVRLVEGSNVETATTQAQKPAGGLQNAPPSNLQPQLDLRLSRIEAKLDKLLGLDESLAANMDNTLEEPLPEPLPTETDMPEDFLV